MAARAHRRALHSDLAAVRRRPPAVARVSDIARQGRPRSDRHPLQENAMQLNAHVDVDLVALEQPDELTVLLEIKAPEAPTQGPRAAAAVQVVLDRSGSMAGERLEAAQSALLSLVDRLDPHDQFGVVAFAATTQTLVPPGPALDTPAIKQAIASLAPGNTTNLSAGLLRGLQEARRVKTAAGATLLLVSDGHAHGGITDADQLAGVAAKPRADGVTISTIGIGLDYHET